ncbi:DUF262 domain-containing protein [Herminiimonas sp. KBW02]|uniref:GmrSD restriction endonuclease domain-containing protein n=1 Tax=Herminiimonas sp. KBW02 TaxID=2153363 RepID=UPI000F5B558F|nr:DUF262 domain-containing protein [Herminiimonas sp. KBW02]RQO33888.1 DUF262 domain-containing protein [Herminiimonas sp. KBW02]
MSIASQLSHLQTQLDLERRLVSFDSYDMSVRQIYEMFVEKAISIPPEYQRQFVWGPERESDLIESILLGIPVPSLFMATNADSTWEIVDGVQRLSTIAHFVGLKDSLLKTINRDSALKIVGLEKLNALNDLTYEDLPKSVQLMFLNRPIRVTVLNDKSDLNVRFDLFERLNTGGVLLTNQEIRNCIFRGPFNESLKKLSKSANFSTAVRLKESAQKNGMSEEYVLRYFAYLENHNQFGHSVKGFLNDYMKVNADKRLSPAKIGLFNKTFDLLAAAYPKGITRGQASTTSANLYEALAVGTAMAVQAGAKVSVAKLSKIAGNLELRKITTGATNSKTMVLKRLHFVRDLLI